MIRDASEAMPTRVITTHPVDSGHYTPLRRPVEFGPSTSSETCTATAGGPAQHGLRRPAGGLQRRGPGDARERVGGGRSSASRRRSRRWRRCSKEAEEDLLAFYRFPAAHWPKLRSTNNLERVNKEIARRSDVVGIFPNDASVIRLVGALLIEQNDEWLLARGYLSRESIALVLEDQGDEDESEVAALER